MLKPKTGTNLAWSNPRSGGLGSVFTLVAGLAIVCVFASGWLAWKQSDADARARWQAENNRLGALLAAQSDVLLRESDLGGVRRIMLDVPASGFDGVCRVELAGLGVVASTEPGEIGVSELPPAWGTALPDRRDGLGVLRVPFTVPERGAGVVEIDRVFRGAAAAPALLRAAFVSLGFAVGCGLLIGRSRRAMSELAIIASALRAAIGGERRAEILRTGRGIGPLADAWNALLTEREDLEVALSVRSAVESMGSSVNEHAALPAACDALASGLIVFDRTGQVQFTNGAAGVLLGRKREQIARATSGVLFADPELAGTIERALEPGAAIRKTHELALGSAAGEPEADLRVTVRSLDAGSDGGALVHIEDVTQQRLSDRSRNAFVAQATHELRTPLTNIRLYVEQAIDEGDSDPSLREQALNVIAGESRRLERIVSDMLSVSEIEAGSLKIRPGPLRTDAMFDELRADYAAQALDKSIELVFDLPPKLPVIHADRDRLGQAIHNLMSNALKYTPSGGKVTVSVESSDNGAMSIAVTDTGIGIDPAECEQIFERFYRANDRRIAHVTGSGLGLALAREIARLHGGDIAVESRIDQGSTFTLTLPPGEGAGGEVARTRAA